MLAAVILVTLAALLSPAQLKEAWRANRDDGLAGTVSFVATLAFAPHIEIGILSGLILSLALLIYRSMKPRVAVLGRHPDGTWRDAARFGLPPASPATDHPAFRRPAAFRQRRHLRGRPPPVLAVERDHPGASRCWLLSCAGINDMDASGVEALRRIRRQLADGRTYAGLLRPQETGHRRAGAHRSVGHGSPAHATYRTEDHALQAPAARTSTAFRPTAGDDTARFRMVRPALLT